uniref:O-fucosyltransferase family protein n=1 Tax=Brassica campestris TaxID=3711 RepID=M4DLL0_BRACM
MAIISPTKSHQVFFNYRGEQLRHSFVSHLTDAFERHGINFIVDKYEQRGKDLKNIFARIEESSIALAIFSTRYPESSWCMDELVKMKKLADKGKIQVIPIFYKVSARDVRRQTGKFGDKFWNLARASITSGDQIKKWKEALECISGKMGLSLKNKRYEMDMLAFSGCTQEEAEELKKMRYAYPWWKEKEVKKEMLLDSTELQHFQNHSSALDFIVSVASDTFIPTYYGTMAKVVEVPISASHRRLLRRRISSHFSAPVPPAQMKKKKPKISPRKSPKKKKPTPKSPPSSVSAKSTTSLSDFHPIDPSFVSDAQIGGPADKDAQQSIAHSDLVLELVALPTSETVIAVSSTDPSPSREELQDSVLESNLESSPVGAPISSSVSTPEKLAISKESQAPDVSLPVVSVDAKFDALSSQVAKNDYQPPVEASVPEAVVMSEDVSPVAHGLTNSMKVHQEAPKENAPATGIIYRFSVGRIQYHTILPQIYEAKEPLWCFSLLSI